MVCDQFYVCVYVFFCKADFCAVDHCGSSKFKFKKLVALGVAAPCSWNGANFENTGYWCGRSDSVRSGAAEEGRK